MKKLLKSFCWLLLLTIFTSQQGGKILFAETESSPFTSYFVHTTTEENTASHITVLNHISLNGNPNAKLIVTQNWNPSNGIGVYNNNVIGVYYNEEKWLIYNENQNDMPLGASFNVYVASSSDDAFVHIHQDGNGYNETFLDHPSLNNAPEAIPFNTHYWTPHEVYNPNTTYVGRDATVNRWNIFKEQADEFNPMPNNAAFHVVVPSSTHESYIHEATSENITSNSTQLDHALLNDNPDAILFVETNWDDGILNYLKNTRANLGVWYSPGSGRWNIFTQDISAISEESKFNVFIPKRANSSTPTLSVTPTNAESGESVTLEGSGYTPGGYIATIRWDGIDVGGFLIPDGGEFSTTFEIPMGATPGSHTITVCSLSPCSTGEFEQSANTTVTVDPTPDPEPSRYTVYLPIVIGGSGDTNPPNSTPKIQIDIDETVEPLAASLPGLNAGDPARPLGAMSDPDGAVATFVQNEIFVETDDMSVINQIVADYSGEILLEIDPTEAGITDLPKMYLIRIDPTVGDVSQLASYLDALDTTENGKVRGEHSFSSDTAAGLMAIAGKEAVGGTTIGVNWVGEPTTPPDSSREATNGLTWGGISYTTNPYNWSFMNRGSVQDIGTADAWNVLIHGGKWDNRVPYAVLDKGFATNNDYPDSTTHISIFPWVTADGDRGGSASPWHGNHVMQTAMAEADNFYGVVGVAHTVAEPINIYTGYDYVTSIASVIAARAAGAKVINMSYSAEVPAVVSFTVLPFEHTTMAIRASGALLFASAGNDYQDVDAERCFIGICWERTWHTPCENNGVVCVGGIEWNSTMRARSVDGSGRTTGGSNWGSDGGVHMFAPYRVYMGADPDNLVQGGNVSLISGTSFSSPYAGGVAALIWAADPSLSANQVLNIMNSTAHTSPDASVPRYVNAYAAVREAVGEVASAKITSPSAGSDAQQGTTISFNAEIGAVLENETTFTYSWTSNIDGALHSGSWNAPLDESGSNSNFFIDDLSSGTHTITFSMTGGGFNATDSVSIQILNTAPTAVIEYPSNNAEICSSQEINFLGSSFDPNQLDGIPALGYNWRSSLDGNLGNGNPLPISFLSTGEHTITLTVTDDGGLSETETVSLTILGASDPDCFNLKPTASITSPANDSSFHVDTMGIDGIWYKTLTLVGQIDDQEDAYSELTVEWIDSVAGPLGSGTVNTSTGSVTITHNFTATGCGTSHMVTLRVTDSGGKTNDIIPHTIFISQLC